MIPIEAEEKRIGWDTIRAEYIGSEISGRKLAEKYGVSYATLQRRAVAEEWTKLRNDAKCKSDAKIVQKTADAVADNAVIAERIKKKLLLRLERIEQKYPLDATEIRTRQGNSMAIYRIRDLTGAYKDLTDDIQAGNDVANELLQSLIALERGQA